MVCCRAYHQKGDQGLLEQKKNLQFMFTASLHLFPVSNDESEFEDDQILKLQHSLPRQKGFEILL